MRKKIKISKDASEGIKTLAAGAAVVAGIVIGFKNGYSPLSISKGKKIADAAMKAASSKDVAETAVKAVETGREVVKETVMNAPKRFEVQFKAFKTGEWYTKTLTDYKRSAYSVANCCPEGRASRVIDHLTGEIDDVFEGAPEIYKLYQK